MRQMLSPGDVSLPGDDVSAHRMRSEMETRLPDKARENLSCWYEEDLEIYDDCMTIHHQFAEALQGARQKSGLEVRDTEPVA